VVGGGRGLWTYIHAPQLLSPITTITMAMSRFEHDHPTHNMNHTEIDKVEATHAEYGHDDNDPTIHTPKEHEYAAGEYLHRGTSFEKKVLRKIDLRLVPVLCELIFDLVVQADSRPAFMYACSLIDRTNLP
jgi:hypothetical protein